MLRPDQLLAAVPDSDVVVLSAPATPQTRHLVDADFLVRMPSQAVLVNVARGSLIDEAALLASLDRGTPAAAILDVFAHEPLPTDSALWSHPRVLVTPHSSAGGLGRHARNADLFLENLTRFRSGQPLLHQVTRAHLSLAD
jgi:phosphoglycerate dehydrogenase-like enzyme